MDELEREDVAQVATTKVMGRIDRKPDWRPHSLVAYLRTAVKHAWYDRLTKKEGGPVLALDDDVEDRAEPTEETPEDVFLQGEERRAAQGLGVESERCSRRAG